MAALAVSLVRLRVTSMRQGVLSVGLLGVPTKIAQAIVVMVAVTVTAIDIRRRTGANERLKRQDVYPYRLAFAVQPKRHCQISSGRHGMGLQYGAPESCGPSIACDDTVKRSYAPAVGYLV